MLNKHKVLVLNSTIASQRPVKTEMKYNINSSDEHLVKGCIEGNQLAQKYLYERFAGRMLGICMRYTSNRVEAREILNIAFVKVFDSLGNYTEQGTLAGWIAKIIFRSAVDHVRANIKYKKAMVFNFEKEKPIENEALSALNTEALFELIQRLKAQHRIVFCMYVIDGYTHKEIAKTLDISAGTSKWYLSEARKSLKHLFIKTNNYGNGGI